MYVCVCVYIYRHFANASGHPHAEVALRTCLDFAPFAEILQHNKQSPPPPPSHVLLLWHPGQQILKSLCVANVLLMCC